MSSTYHTPIAVGASNDPATVNTPLGQLDAALTSILSGSGGGSAEVIDARAAPPSSPTPATLRLALEYAAGRIYNVRAFGATGDGATDDTSAVQAAINAAPVGSTIYFPDGTYMVSDIKLKANRTYRGSFNANGSTLKMPNGANGSGVLVSEEWWNSGSTVGGALNIFDLRIDGNKANNSSGAGIILMNNTCTVERVRIANTAGVGLRITDTNRTGGFLTGANAVDNRIVACIFNETGSHAIHGQNGSGASRVTDGFISECVIINVTGNGNGIELEVAVGWNITRNHIWGSQPTCTMQHAIRAPFGHQTFITENYIESFGYAASLGECSAIRCASGLASGLVIANNIIKNNRTEAGNTYKAIVVSSGTSINYPISITGNVMKGNLGDAGTETAITLSNSSGGTLTGIISGNTIHDYSTIAALPAGGTDNVMWSANWPRPTFSAHKNGSNQTIAGAGTNELVTWGTERFDKGGMYDAGTGRFTPTIPGYYQLSACVQYASATDQSPFTIALYKNGSVHQVGAVTRASGTGHLALLISTVVFANGTGDYFEIFSGQSSGSNKDIDGTSSKSWFTGVQV